MRQLKYSKTDLTLIGRASLIYSQSTTNKMQRFTVYFCKTLYMFQTGFSAYHQELKTAHTASGIGLKNT